MRTNDLKRGIALMLTSSLCTCVGQLLWKLSSAHGLLLLLCGFGLYGCGALLMLLALRYGELSTLHPMLSMGYILSIVLGAAILRETISPQKLLGIAVIGAGLVLISAPEKGGE